ncbi:MAG: hypothetical protein VW714_00110, partial [Rhodospirillales bacterium]
DKLIEATRSIAAPPIDCGYSGFINKNIIIRVSIAAVEIQFLYVSRASSTSYSLGRNKIFMSRNPIEAFNKPLRLR